MDMNINMIRLTFDNLISVIKNKENVNKLSLSEKLAPHCILCVGGKIK